MWAECPIARQVFSLVSLRDLSRLQSVHRFAKEILEEGSVWHQCLTLVLPQLAISPELLEPRLRRGFLTLCPTLMQATFAAGPPLAFTELEATRALVKDLDAALATARAHLERGGRAAAVALVHLKYACKDVDLLIDTMDCHGYSAAARGGDALFQTSHVEVEVDWQLTAALGAPRCRSLRLGFGWQAGHLCMKAWDDEHDGVNAETQHSGPGLLLDLHSTSSALLLDYRRAHVVLNHAAWRRGGHGLCLPLKKGTSTAAAALREGLPVAVCLREAGVAERKASASAVCQVENTIEALQLEPSLLHYTDDSDWSDDGGDGFDSDQ